MSNDEKIELAQSFGLIFAGFDDEGQLTFLGEDNQWKLYEDERDNIEATK